MEFSKVTEGDRVYVSGSFVSQNIGKLQRIGLLYDKSVPSWWIPKKKEAELQSLVSRLMNEDNTKVGLLRTFIMERARCYLQESAYVAELMRKDTKEVKEEDVVFLLKDIYGCYNDKLRNVTRQVSSIVESLAISIGENFSSGAKLVVNRAITSQVVPIARLSKKEIEAKLDESRRLTVSIALKKYKTVDEMVKVSLQKIYERIPSFGTGDFQEARRVLLAALILLPLKSKEKFYSAAADLTEETRLGKFSSLGLNKKETDELISFAAQRKLHQEAVKKLVWIHTGELLKKIKKEAIMSRSAFFSTL
ncbi:hypothetical protein ISTM_110 [Insectomime virus]|uniref:Uncharacterized protein n=1 Tax=Tunisvirus fontaine2 TaxID=1421067 RepID=V9SGB4_9VIRU|nr:hypothetical protein D1R32_gp212 [Tunisvirus fontaine2]AHA46008.1 hypothetical protein ISTM_110 [Insectomime virus]AHC54929.1 hypothetical protein TNS_ORF211 [Tunisvirus fontaine2]